MRLLFQDSSGHKREIADVSSLEEAVKEIDECLKDYQLVCYGMRTWEYDGWIIFDVGSHSECFYLEVDKNHSNKSQ